MPFPLLAMAGLSIGGNILGGLFGKKSADRQADAQVAAAQAASQAQLASANAALAEQRRQYDLTRGDALSAQDQIRGDNESLRRDLINRITQSGQSEQNALGNLQNRLLFQGDQQRAQYGSQLGDLQNYLTSQTQNTGDRIQNALTGTQRTVDNTLRNGLADVTRSNSNAQAGIGGLVRDLNRSSSQLTEPYRQAGIEGINALRNVGQNFNADPGYEFRRNEGNRGIENSFAARGGALSGNALRSLNEFNSGLASQEYGNYFNRDLARAQNLAGLGQFGTSSQLASDQYGTGINANAAQNFAGMNQNAIQNVANQSANTAQNLAGLGVNSNLSLNALNNQTQQNLANLGINADLNVNNQTLSGLQNLAGLSQNSSQFNTGNYLNALTGINNSNANAAYNTTGLLSNLGQNYANNTGNINLGLGQAQGNNFLYSGQAQAQGINQGTNSLLGGLGSALQNGMYGLQNGYFNQGRTTNPNGLYTPTIPNMNWLAVK